MGKDPQNARITSGCDGQPKKSSGSFTAKLSSVIAATAQKGLCSSTSNSSTRNSTSEKMEKKRSEPYFTHP